jgi:hypothetical protein
MNLKHPPGPPMTLANMREQGVRGLAVYCLNHACSDHTSFSADTRAEQYRVKAKKCAERAKAARDPEAKRTCEDLARQWLNLAKQAEQGGGGS